MMDSQLTTFVLVGGLIGFLTDGTMMGVGAGALVFIAHRIDKYLDMKKEVL